MPMLPAGPADVGEHLVACEVAVRVVDLLEAVHVDHQRHRP
jgi:hypothetical protein